MKQLNFSLSTAARRGEVRWWSIIFFHSLINRQHHGGCQCPTGDKQRGALTWQESWKPGPALQMELGLLQPELNSLARNTSTGPDPAWDTPFFPDHCPSNILPLLLLVKQLHPSPASTPFSPSVSNTNLPVHTRFFYLS